MLVLAAAVLVIPVVPAEEVYHDAEPYERDVTYITTREEMIGGESLLFGCYLEVYVGVRNTDAEGRGGVFNISMQVQEVNTTITHSYGNSTRIDPGEEHEFYLPLYWEYKRDCGTDNYALSYAVDPPTTIDERVVTRTRSISKSIIQILTGG